MALSSTRKLWLKRQIDRLKGPGDAVLGTIAVWLLRLVRRSDPVKSARLFGRLAQLAGPLVKQHRIGRENLAAAFPEKTPEEREAILMGVWDNLGRTAAEYAHLDRLWDFDWQNPSQGRIVADQIEAFNNLRDDGKPAVIFAAHLANWELPALLTAMYNFRGAVVYRMPKNRRIADEILRIRSGLMGQLIPTGIEGSFTTRAVLEEGGHVGMLVDQHYSGGTPVTFFGRTCLAHPVLARLARLYDCPIVGVRVVRLPEDRFKLEMVGPLEPPRDAKGRIDEQATMQMVTTIIEGWIRENPSQWLWLHRRWREMPFADDGQWTTGDLKRRRAKRPFERE